MRTAPASLHPHTRTLLGVALILTALALQPTVLGASLQRFYTEHGTLEFLLRSAIILALYGLALLAVVLGGLCQGTVKWPLFVLFALSMSVNSVFYQASHLPMGYPDWVILWRARADFDNASRQYASATILALAQLAPLLLAYLLLRPSRRRTWPWALAALGLSIGLFVALCVSRQGRATERLPGATNLYGMMIAAAFDRPPEAYRYTTDRRPDGPRGADHLALIVDEGTRYDLFTHVVLPNIRQQSSVWHIYDFGAATAMADCSAETNIMLRKLVSFEHIARDLYHEPLVWSLAHNAGFSTWLLDAQHHGEGHDYFDRTERALIEHRPEVRTGHDTNLIQHLMRAWKTSASFTYVIKQGTHFPYSQEYPPTYRSASPARQVPYVQADTRRIQAVDSVDYQTGQFFHQLLRTAPSGRVAIFYTADHGLNIGDGPGTDHCNSMATSRVEVAMVPLLVLTNYPSDALAAAATRNRDQLSQFELVATLKNFLGYDSAASTRSGLLRTVQTPIPGFVSGSAFGLFGRPVEIMPVDRALYQRLEQQRWPASAPRGGTP
ncbi:sulfatase-like hydrolase/transferase [Castellaniella caeni]|uniref:sulfatase-like hydrolase/transferase n=1 Tax=Castellaniella caeni TaxID=266123 RepID=UPI00082A9A49|nr:sulfatase-like hydrolase/transferase [Castellaniella caeni]